MTSDDPQPQPAPATLAKKIRALKEEIPPRTVSSWTPAVAMIIEARNDGIEAAARLAEEAEPAPCVLNERNHMQGLPDPDRPGRVLHPFNHSEDPTFLPGDKVRDKRDHSGKVWRIVRRVAHLDDEMMTLRDVGDDANERTLLASSIVPHLEMVAMWQPALSPGEKAAIAYYERAMEVDGQPAPAPAEEQPGESIERRYRIACKTIQSLTAALAEANGCPCLYTTPCSSNCSCAHEMMSGGCQRCCRYGRPEHRRAAAERLVRMEAALAEAQRERDEAREKIRGLAREAIRGLAADARAVLRGRANNPT